MQIYMHFLPISPKGKNNDWYSFWWPYMMILKDYMGQSFPLSSVDSVVSELHANEIRLQFQADKGTASLSTIPFAFAAP